VAFIISTELKRAEKGITQNFRFFRCFWECDLFPELHQYYSTQLPFVTNQTHCHGDTAASVLEASASELARQQEWESEWNHSGLPSRLSEKVGFVVVDTIILAMAIFFVLFCCPYRETDGQ
jgi:hypothetical protein